MKKQAKVVGSPKGRKVGKKTSARNTESYSGRLGAVIRERREKLGMTVEAFKLSLAQHDVTILEPTIYHWESGRNPIPINAMPAIALVLKMPIRKLMPET